MVKNLSSQIWSVFSLRGVEVGVTPPGTIGNVYSSKLNMKIPGHNYKFDELFPPPASTRGAVASAHGTPDYYQQVRRGV